MNIRWLPHARARLRERHLSERLVRETIRQPQQVMGRGPHQVLQRRYVDAVQRKEYVLRVFVERLPGQTLVRSVYRTSKIHKYWRAP